MESVYPIISFLHVPGKMSKPLWLMLGTAFRFSLAGFDTKHYLLTSKHTFSPWEFTSDASQLKIPEEFRKMRYVVGRIYQKKVEHGLDISSTVFDDLSLKLVHPTMDLAVIEQTSFRHVQVNEVALSLNPSYLPKGSPVLIYGFRGNGQLGELDTLDAGVLDSLPEEERKQFLASLENVEGKQSGALCSALVVDPRGMCKGVSDVDQCFHGMSGSPLLSADHLSTGGILYGKHASCETNIGYVPSKEIVDWLKGALS